MSKKKWAVGATGILMSLSLVACGESSKTVATTDGGKITQEQYYNKMKGTQQGKQELQQMILNKVLEHKYGDKVKESEVNSQLDKYKKQYGSQFSAMLQQQGMTESQLKDSIRDNLLLKQAVLDKTSFSNKDLEKQFKSYQPKVTVKAIVTKDKSTAETVISDLDNGQKWDTLAKKYSINSSNKNDGGKLPAFDNSNSTVDSSFKKASFKLKNGEYTKTPVKTKEGYQVIEMVNHPSKGSLNDHKAEVKDQLATQRMNDSDTLHNVVSKVLKDGDVHIEDKSLQNILSGYIDTPKN
ncbi:peptidylprolyl isomerase [Fructilactobacillus lindneri]|uniref:Foldase protein PrsA n=1 Tax=Fructilactobacillus lindneri DSM 20690 = JCM 11027 TaxID=1122148 RepID=A0A0R2JPQ1_9LACO|nr:peptidylprolyl isomerase [Fructilactobacillus lindneri]KRN79113.1 Foldase protein prsA [Fructilactobacillus lindneri DSM 20690 = JCM 11027]POH07761.1 peptidylprolyl isomerase [Fructilactobacillus lindneri]POH24651.1 peptidylprolyl isomerase [Fructilactobacillus lindneri DSM 20690 = JCM 11027]SJZ75110.1 foldase protein PrsA [Fructilactobacillus lindneri DSM 20690 = JCM 11027]